MIDPIHSLSLSIQSNRGIYAILLGSGISQAAGIPTGWGITLDLTCKLAAMHGEKCEPAPEEWYMEKYKTEPNYSELLDNLAKTQAERQQLLRGYWEATEQERVDGLKQPTIAHRAIAKLASSGIIKVILTTNFDRLMENALTEEGVTPTVLSTPDQVIGALPLIHTQCCLFKVHGDYLDTRIRNTPQELAIYPPEYDRLLERIFDEFGLIVCGWSADWDVALRNAILRAPSRRFTTFWATINEPSDEAKKIISQRSAQLITIKDANSFFQTLEQNVKSLEAFAQPHPLSVEIAVSNLKRYLSEPRYRIQLADLINEEVTRALETIKGYAFPVQNCPGPEPASAISRVHAYEAACTTLVAMAIVGGFWIETEHEHFWQLALERLIDATPSGGFIFWTGLRSYPGTLLLYSLGIGAVEAGRLQFLNRLFATTYRINARENVPAIKILPPFCLFDGGNQVMDLLKGTYNSRTPLNDSIHELFLKPARKIIPDRSRYTLAFDKLEILIALSYAYKRGVQENYWVPPGAFLQRPVNSDRILQEIEESISGQGDQSIFVASEIFGKSATECSQAIVALRDFISRAQVLWY